jgi:DivIVA domain-containing protein
MPLFGKRKRRSAMTTPEWAYEAPPIEQVPGQSASAARAPDARLTPEDVRNVAFSKPPIGKRGYNEDEVDAFLDRIEEALRDLTGNALTAEDVRNVAFSKPPIGKRGYNEDEVDAFLDRLEEAIRQRATGADT